MKRCHVLRQTFKNECKSRVVLISQIKVCSVIWVGAYHNQVKCNNTNTEIFLTAIWLPHGQLWTILKGTASLTRC